jgi:hypothetical protein
VYFVARYFSNFQELGLDGFQVSGFRCQKRLEEKLRNSGIEAFRD